MFLANATPFQVVCCKRNFLPDVTHLVCKIITMLLQVSLRFLYTGRTPTFLYFDLYFNTAYAQNVKPCFPYSGSTPTFLYLYFNTAYAAHYVYCSMKITYCRIDHGSTKAANCCTYWFCAAYVYYYVAVSIPVWGAETFFLSSKKVSRLSSYLYAAPGAPCVNTK